DQCVERGVPIARQSVTTVLRGLAYAGYRFGRPPHRPENLAQAYRGNLLNQLRRAQVVLGDDELPLLDEWLLGRLQTADAEAQTTGRPVPPPDDAVPDSPSAPDEEPALAGAEPDYAAWAEALLTRDGTGSESQAPDHQPAESLPYPEPDSAEKPRGAGEYPWTLWEPAASVSTEVSGTFSDSTPADQPYGPAADAPHVGNGSPAADGSAAEPTAAAAGESTPETRADAPQPEQPHAQEQPGEMFVPYWDGPEVGDSAADAAFFTHPVPDAGTGGGESSVANAAPEAEDREAPADTWTVDTAELGAIPVAPHAPVEDQAPASPGEPPEEPVTAAPEAVREDLLPPASPPFWRP
ncbi:MAG TPA: hypothetical protein VHG08_10760, partial [Longimicrobium sp.]|nr:hypothetical protein [Longimicrobium sp.]